MRGISAPAFAGLQQELQSAHSLIYLTTTFAVIFGWIEQKYS